jgi:serine/threonine-protein kinase
VERIGEYLVRRLVGEGGMGKVYEAEERLSHRKVALKVLRPELARSEEGRRLFLNEMTILAHLDHANVVRCLACAEIDGDLVMALEYLEGSTLRAALSERGRLPWHEAVGVTAQIASALAAAHRQQPPIIHRDLKPENVMILEDGSVKVMDFGIAKVLEALARNTTHSVGTLQYMSPEQIDAAGVDARSDLYCLGLLLYEMLAGRPPFESASPRELLNLQCTAPPPPLPHQVRKGLPRGVEQLLGELLAKAPDDRPAAARDVLHDLEPFVAAGGDRIEPSARPSRPEVRGGDREPAAGAAPAPSTRREPSQASERLAAAASARPDTIALVELAAEPRQLSTRSAALVVLVLCLLAGAVTYLVRSRMAPAEADRAPPAAGAPGPPGAAP